MLKNKETYYAEICICKIKGLFWKNGKQNSIEVGTMENGNIYQDSVVKIENPAIATAI